MLCHGYLLKKHCKVYMVRITALDLESATGEF